MTDFLKDDPKLWNYYKWVTGLKNAPYIDVIEGSYIARPVQDNVPKDLNNKATYYKEEKGTDVNFSVHAMTKAFYNSYDIGFFISADTDYVTVYKALKDIGKLSEVVVVKGQNIHKLKPHIDNYIVLEDDFFKSCLRQSQKNN